MSESILVIMYNYGLIFSEYPPRALFAASLSRLCLLCADQLPMCHRPPPWTWWTGPHGMDDPTGQLHAMLDASLDARVWAASACTGALMAHP